MSNVSEFFFSLLCLFNECFAAVLKKVHLMYWPVNAEIIVLENINYC